MVNDCGMRYKEYTPPPPLSCILLASCSPPQEPLRTDLASFVCPYFGAVKVLTDAHTGDDGEELPARCLYFLVLQDMCNGLDNPSLLDVKMGRVTVEPGEREVR